MRSYLIDEISAPDMDRVREYLKEKAIISGLEQVFWVQMPDDLLNETQLKHRECSPHVFAVELGEDWLRLEFFVRSLKSMRCTCPGYATSAQRDHVISFAHEMIRSLGIST